jgi:uncharacterized membrane protein YhdT
MADKKSSGSSILDKALTLKKLTYSDNFLFLLSIILYSDIFSILIIHHSIIDINTAHLNLNDILKETTVINIILFCFGFGLLYIIGFSLLYYLAISIIFKISKIDEFESSPYYGLKKYDLLQYAIKYDNQITFELYQQNEKKNNHLHELKKLSLIVIFLSVIEIYFFFFTKKHCVLDMLKKIPNFFHISGIYIYLLFIILLLYFVVDITKNFSNHSDYIYYNNEIKSMIEQDLGKSKEHRKNINVANQNPAGSINPHSSTKLQ